MTKPIIIIHNVSTNEIIEREMTDAEFAVYEADQAAQATAQAAIESKAAQRRAILEHLKITEEEARILLGGN
jgi:type IV secretory pathway VirB9-like protein